MLYLLPLVASTTTPLEARRPERSEREAQARQLREGARCAPPCGAHKPGAGA